jgi:peptide chain release factor subunit 1
MSSHSITRAQSAMSSDSGDKAVEQWKIRRLIKTLDAAKGSGTSMISLIIPPKDQVSRVVKLLNDESATASNIKSRVNRLSVQSAITSVLGKLKLYTKIPDNGLIIYSGSDTNEKRISVTFEPYKPINTSLYLCDSSFHTEALHELLVSDEKYGFIIVDGNGALYGTLCGSTKTVLHKFTVDLPKKHGRGGQSAQRFGRIRMEKRQAYIRKVAEIATQLFISNCMPNVIGIILAGSAEFKQQLQQSEVFDPQLLGCIIGVVDVSYGGENGFNQAIELSSDILKNTKLAKEKKLISSYFGEISKDTGKICYGIKDTVVALEMGGVETLILWENLQLYRYVETRGDSAQSDSVQSVRYSNSNCDEVSEGTTVTDVQLLVDWMALNYKTYGCSLEFVTDCSSEGAQFVQGFGGIGAILRYPIDFADEVVGLQEDVTKDFEKDSEKDLGYDEDFM